MTKKFFGEKLLSLRKSKKASQAEVAEYIGLTVSAYQNYENGRREAGYETISKLADFYGVTTDYLLGREKQANPFENLIKPVSDEKFIELYSGLPEYAKSIFLETMAKLSKVVTENESMNNDISITTTLGTTEDERQADEAAKQDAG